MKIKVLTSFVIGFMFIACTDKRICCDLVDVGLDISVINEKGEDLLDPSTENYFRFSDIKLFHDISGELVRSDPQRNSPEFIDADFEYPNRISVYALTKETAHNRMYLIWPDNDWDTIDYELDIRKNGGYVVVSKFWYNDEEVNGRTLELTK